MKHIPIFIAIAIFALISIILLTQWKTKAILEEIKMDLGDTIITQQQKPSLGTSPERLTHLKKKLKDSQKKDVVEKDKITLAELNEVIQIANQYCKNLTNVRGDIMDSISNCLQ